MADGAGQIDLLSQNNQNLANVLAVQDGFPQSDTLIGIKPVEQPSASPSKGWLSPRLPWMREACAAEQIALRESARTTPLGRQVQQANYVIVLDQAPTKKEAFMQLTAIRNKVPNARVVESNTGFLIVNGGAPLSQSSAVLEALHMKSELDQAPSLQRVK